MSLGSSLLSISIFAGSLAILATAGCSSPADTNDVAASDQELRGPRSDEDRPVGNGCAPDDDGDTSSPSESPPHPGQACSEEAKVCPDGSTVARTGPNCAFAPCPGEGQACTEEAMLCPDGSYVARTGPNCAFAPCP